MTHDQPNYSDFLPSGQPNWVDTRPDEVTCATCGAIQPPHKHPSAERWIAAAMLCDDCQLAADEARWEAERARDAFEARWLKSGVPRLPALHAERGIDLHPQLTALCELPADHNGSAWGVYITGPVGTGKTTQAVAAIRRHLEYWSLERPSRTTARYANVPKLLSLMKESFGKKEQFTLSEFESCGFLVLDDLGREGATPWAAEQLYLLVEARCNEMRPTVFTSNFSLSELSGSASKDGAGAGHGNYDQRITSRIFQMCGGSVGQMSLIRLDDINYRLPLRH